MRWKNLILLALIIIITIKFWYLGLALLFGLQGYQIIKKQQRKKELGEGEFGPVREEIKKEVWQLQHGQCAYPQCTWTKTMHLHHVIHREDGGDNRVSNLMYLCPNHHSQKHHEDRKLRRELDEALPTPYRR